MTRLLCWRANKLCTFQQQYSSSSSSYSNLITYSLLHRSRLFHYKHLWLLLFSSPFVSSFNHLFFTKKNIPSYSTAGFRHNIPLLFSSPMDEYGGGLDDADFLSIDVDAITSAAREKKKQQSPESVGNTSKRRNPYATNNNNNNNDIIGRTDTAHSTTKKQKNDFNTSYSRNNSTVIDLSTNSSSHEPGYSYASGASRTPVKNINKMRNPYSQSPSSSPTKIPKNPYTTSPLPPPQPSPSSPTITHTSTTPSSHPPLSPNLTSQLTQTLSHHYGYTHFRPGQLSTISSLLSHRDTAVFWATGSGKSLVYQLPALHTRKPALVISPLISLMQDQCHKLNASGSHVATFLGSAQQRSDVVMRRMAQGEYLVIYLTPETFLSQAGRLSSILKGHLKPCLIAVDEAHCVSEWGNDFRPDFREIGMALRRVTSWEGVPLVALTATASPRVRRDIVACLGLKDPFLSVRSFDRVNLEVMVRRKPGGGFTKALSDFMRDNGMGGEGGRKRESTIVYVPTKREVDTVVVWLEREYPGLGVRGYHAGLTQETRDEAHTAFLTSQSPVIVATIAFGMGIDKPDIRNVIHWGAPKTVEEYYQQIGRAGRDGLPAKCLMFANESDFDRYGSDFYLGGLRDASVREAVEKSTQALRVYSQSVDQCRRKFLLNYFGEKVDWEGCGICDICKSKELGMDLERDFTWEGARLVLVAVTALKEGSMAFLEKVMGGNEVDSWRYANGQDPQRVMELIKTETDKIRELSKWRSIRIYKELMPALLQRGYIRQVKRSAMVSGSQYRNTWSAYEITQQGFTALHSQSPIQLPVSPALRDIEAEEKKRRDAKLQQLKDIGIDLDKIPKDELDEGKGDVLDAYRFWYNYLGSLRKQDSDRSDQRLKQLEDLQQQIESWRDDTASNFKVAPGAILPDHTLLKIAYIVATATQPIPSESLHSVGVRSSNLNSLTELLQAWTKNNTSISTFSSSDHCLMVLPPSIKPQKPWKHAVYKPNRKTGLAVWEGSYQKFMSGEDISTIALTRKPRPIQVGTVIGHLLDALVQGHELSRLEDMARHLPLPTREEWEVLSKNEATLGVDVLEEDGSSIQSKEFMRLEMGDEIVDKEPGERTEEENAKRNKWYGIWRWYLALRRVGYEPKFDGDE